MGTNSFIPKTSTYSVITVHAQGLKSGGESISLQPIVKRTSNSKTFSMFLPTSSNVVNSEKVWFHNVTLWARTAQVAFKGVVSKYLNLDYSSSVSVERVYLLPILFQVEVGIA